MRRVPLATRRAARRLCRALQELGFEPEVHEVWGNALIWVWRDVLVWTDGRRYYWWSGEWCRIEPDWRKRRWLYAYCPASDPVSAAAQIGELYARLRNGHPLSYLKYDSNQRRNASFWG